MLGGIAFAAIWSTTRTFLPKSDINPSIPLVNAIGVRPAANAGPAQDTPAAKVGAIPVLSWHQIDNGCAPTAAQCTNPGTQADSVSQKQFYDQLNWLSTRGYHSITADQYVKWATGQQVMLPSKPVLLTVDDGIVNFYAGGTPVLQHFGYTMVSMVVSGFAQGAQDGAKDNVGWDATWTQLTNLPARTWEFAFHAGPQGHVISTNPKYKDCAYFYPCQRPGEPTAAYHARVTGDINTGLAAENDHLGDRFDDQMWAVPFNDLGQDPSQPTSGTANANWAAQMADKKFKVVFVDAQTTTENQHYRYEVHGKDTLGYFAQQVQRSDLFVRNPEAATANAPAGGVG
ncbi:MAG TPA: hypothetical protein VH478_20350 [Trebonia sp.]|nr:hypothetical protein [Trebonia sp.]